MHVLRRSQVERLTGLSRSTIYELMRDGKFPRQIRLSEKSVGWIADEIEAWVKQRVAKRDNVTDGRDGTNG